METFKIENFRKATCTLQVKLQKDIMIDNENYGYMLIPRKDLSKASSYYPQWDDTYKVKNFGWKIEG